MDWTRFIRPSGIPALALCPGRAQMEARVCADDPGLERWTSDAANMGTMAHDAIAQTLSVLWFTSAAETAEDAMQQTEGMQQRLDTWTKAVVRGCVSYAVDVMTALRASHPGQRVRIFIERHLSGEVVGIKRGGTADLILVCGDDLIIVDWKCGFLYQGSAATHWQMHTYAVLAYEKYRPKRIVAHLAQGRLGNFSAAEYYEADIARLRNMVASIVTESEWEHAALCPSPSIDACGYCKALTRCREAGDYIMRACDEAALFGTENADRVKLANDAALAKRFVEAVKEQQKRWREENAKKDGET